MKLDAHHYSLLLKLNSRGVIRVFEAVFAASIILISFLIFINLVPPSNPMAYRMQVELEKMGYDVLYNLAQSEAIDEILFYENGTLRADWDARFKIVLQNCLPRGIFFNLTVYNVTYTPDGQVQLEILQSSLSGLSYVSNYESGQILGTSVEITYVYTTKIWYNNVTKKLWNRILILHLVLSRGESSL